MEMDKQEAIYPRFPVDFSSTTYDVVYFVYFPDDD